MKHLAILYTNNHISLKAFKKVLSCFAKTVSHPSLPFDTLGVIISVHPVPDLLEIEYNNVKNILAPQEIINKGHLSIIEKISLALKLFPSEYISLHEHDVLYPEEYLLTVQSVLEQAGSNFDYLAYNNMIGVNKTGYQQRTVLDYPLSTLTFPSPIVQDVLDHKRKEFTLNKGWCYIEPGYGGSYGAHLRRLQLGNGSAKPVVHINMNQTSENHHLTDHYLTYEPVSKIGFSEWPGDLSFVFSNTEHV